MSHFSDMQRPRPPIKLAANGNTSAVRQDEEQPDDYQADEGHESYSGDSITTDGARKLVAVAVAEAEKNYLNEPNPSIAFNVVPMMAKLPLSECEDAIFAFKKAIDKRLHVPTFRDAIERQRSTARTQHRELLDHTTRSASKTDHANVAHNLTDIGNSARFCIDNGNDMKFCYERNSWLFWDGKRWKWDDSGRAIKLAKRTALKILASAKDQYATGNQDRAEAVAKWGIASQKRERIVAMVALAQPELVVAAADLDADPMLLNCINGTANLSTGEIYQHRRDDLITKMCRGSYRTGASAPQFKRFVDRIFKTSPAVVDFIHRAIGYAATGSVKEQCLFFCHGKGSNGKSTLFDAVMHALGDYAQKTDPDLLMAKDGSGHPCSVADLLGLRCVITSETDDGKRFDEAKLKDLSGEQRIKARFMRENFFEFQATHKIFLYSNHKPVVRGTDHGFWRRIRMIPFIEQISGSEIDLDLTNKLAAEVDGVLTWIIAGAVAWARDGLKAPTEVIEATSGYRKEMDRIGQFIAERCEEGPGLTALAKDLYTSYCAWSEGSGEHPLTQRRLGTSLGERGYAPGRCSYSGRSTWTGIGIRADVKPKNDQPKVQDDSPF